MGFNPLTAALVAFIVASLMSMGGLSGAFLLLPFQVSVLGLTGPAVTPTNHLYNVVAIPAGAYRYFRERRMVWPLVGVVLVGTLPAVLLGSLIRIHWLADPRPFKLFVGCVLALIGSRLVLKPRARSAPDCHPTDDLTVKVVLFSASELRYRFAGHTHKVPVPKLIVLSAIIGLIGGAYGIGGGAILAPILVSAWALPVYTIAGASLAATLATSVLGVVFFGFLSVVNNDPTLMPDWTIGLSFGVGGLFGTYVGASLQRHIGSKWLELLLAVSVGGLGISYIVRFFI